MLADDGHDMNLPTWVDFHVAAPTEEAAEKIAAAAKDLGYETSIEFDDGEDDKERESIPSSEAKSAVQQIGRYQVIRILGEGGFGCVYLAEDKQLQRSVAIKLPNNRWQSTDFNAAKEYLAEARTLAGLDHPDHGRRARQRTPARLPDTVPTAVGHDGRDLLDHDVAAGVRPRHRMDRRPHHRHPARLPAIQPRGWP